MIKYLFWAALLFSSVLSTAQTITVVDKTNLKPLPDVAVYTLNPSRLVRTNNDGKADISIFTNSDSLYIKHIGYLEKKMSYAEISKGGQIIALSERSFSLEEVVISSNRFEEKREDIAQQIQVIRSKELSFINQQTTADVIQSTGNVLVQKSQLGGGSPIIRGFETNKVLMVVDGVRMNNAIYRGGHLQNIITLDNTILDRVEIVFGPGSVVYGSDALGGVMHFYTKNPVLSDSSGMRIGANAFARYGTAAHEKTGHVDVTLGGKKFGSLTSFTFSDFGDLRQGNIRNPFYGNWGKRTFYVERINNKDSMIVNPDVNIQKQSGYSQYDILQKFLFRQSENVSHILNFQYSNSSNIPRYDRLTTTGSNGLPSNAVWYYGPQKRLFGSYTLSLKGNSFYENARVILGYQNVEESRNDRRFNSTNFNHRIEQLDIFTFNADFSKNVGKNELRYGLEGTHNIVNSTANRENISTGVVTPIDTRYPDGGSTMSSGAAYLTHTLEITDKLILNDGLRLSYVQLYSKFNDKSFFPFPYDEVKQKNTALNGNLGLVFMPGADWRFTVVGSTGFRAPNVDDMSKVFESVQGNVIVPNPNLEPEYTRNLDLGFSKSVAKTVSFGATGFYTWYRNAITVVEGSFEGQDSIVYNGVKSNVRTTDNAAKAYIYGLNAFLNADVTQNFSITNTLNYTFGRIKRDPADYPLDHVPPVFGKTSFLLSMNRFKGEFFVMYNGAKRAKDFNLLGEDNQAYSADPVNGYMPGWYTLNIRTGYQFTKNLQMQVALENILDQHYRVFASNISAPGRNFVVTLRGNL
jgi:hemoglobin/transferrin/lactoferrin receptor protein